MSTDFNNPEFFQQYAMDHIDFQLAQLVRAVLDNGSVESLRDGSTCRVITGANIHLVNSVVAFPRAIGFDDPVNVGISFAEIALDCGSVDDIKDLNPNVSESLDIMIREGLFEKVRSKLEVASSFEDSVTLSLHGDSIHSTLFGSSVTFSASKASPWSKQAYEYLIGSAPERLLNVSVCIPMCDVYNDLRHIVTFWATVLSTIAPRCGLGVGTIIINLAQAYIYEVDTEKAEKYHSNVLDLGAWVQIDNKPLEYCIMKPISCVGPISECAGHILFSEHVNFDQLEAARVNKTIQ